MKKRSIALLLAVLLCLGLFAACGKTETPAAEEPAPAEETPAAEAPAEETPAAEEPAPAAEDTVIVIGIPNTWNQLICYNPSSAYHLEISEKIYDRLCRVNPAGQAEPKNAESWEMSEDKMTITFHLRQDSYFTDGEQVTSADWMWTLGFITGEPGTQMICADKFSCLEGTDDRGRLQDGQTLGAEAPDDFTLVLHLKKPMTVDSFMTGYGFLWYVLPEHLLKDLDTTDVASWDYWQNPVGSGPCKFVSQDAGATEIVLDANKDYPVGDIQFDKMIYRVIATDAAASSFMAGEINMYYMGFTPDDLTALQGTEGLRFDLMDSVSSLSTLNINNERFDLNFRKAVNLAIDKDLIGEAVYSGAGVASNTPVSEYNPYCHNSWTGRDVEAAKALLAESSVDLTQTFKCAVSAGKGEQMGAIIQQNLAEIGVNIELITVDTATNLAGMKDGTYDMGTGGYTSSGSPVWIVTSNIFGQNVGHIDTAPYVDLQGQCALLTDTAEIEKVGAEFQTLCDEQVPFITLVHRYDYYVFSDWLSNVSPIETTACYEWVCS